MSQSVDPMSLRRIQALDAMEPPLLEALAKHLRASRFVEGARICIEGQNDERCYFLMSGTVRVSKVVGDGRNIPLATLQEGCIFGQAGIIEGQPRTAQVDAIGEVDALYLERATLDWALERKQPWALELQQIIAVAMMRQLRSAIGRFEMLVSLDPASREALVEGEVITPSRQQPVYMNLSGSFASLPAATPSQSGAAMPAARKTPPPASHQRSEEDQRLYELLQVVSPEDKTSGQ